MLKLWALTGHQRYLAGVIHVFMAQENYAPVFHRRRMKELSIDAIDQCKASFGRNAAALNKQISAVFGDGHNRLNIAVSVEVKGAVVAVTGQPEAVKGILVKDHLGNARQVAGNVGEPCLR